jgi:chemotaxis protein MotB
MMSRGTHSYVRPLALCVAGILGAATLGGCVSQGDYDNAAENARAANNGKTRAERERDEARAAADLMRNQLVRAETANKDLQDQNAKMRAALDAAGGDLKGLMEKLALLEFGPVDTQTDEALQKLAAMYPDLIKYDADRGMLRFASDLTFDSGSDAVKDSARSGLQALAKILSTGPAMAYEIHIVGHTDSQKISSTTERLHKTNMHLSCHRAISVRKELVALGVPSDKMQAAGWGEFRPYVPNTASGNTPQNRRVEIYLARARGAMAAQADAGNTPAPERTTPPDRQPDVTK